MPLPLHLAVALDGAGWHPAAWRAADAHPEALFTAGYWLDLVSEAERGLLDLVTFEDSLSLQSTRYGADDDRTDQVRGRLDTVLVAARVAPLTAHIGLVPTVVATHTEPFHISKAIATLDYVSQGRAGVRVRVSAAAHEAAHFGRRTFPASQNGAVLDPAHAAAARDPYVHAVASDLFAEAADYIEVVRRLWDSWEDGAEIRDAASGRFIDRDKLHYIDFDGRWFSVKGPSITPRPPQGQPIVSVLSHASAPSRLGATSADLVYVTPRDAGEAAALVGEIRRERATAGRDHETVHVFADLAVLLDDSAAAAADRKARWDQWTGAPYDGGDARLVTGTPAELADLLLDWQQAGISGFRLRPAGLPHDLRQIARGLVPELQRRGAFRTEYAADTLRGLLGLPRPANRYAAA
jgi:alkanesulfonate monooxygenase SsuD/methylene tetrahydromethanopterin reductase-like flavin-dependent oxidoreductase (luciferase family)